MYLFHFIHTNHVKYNIAACHSLIHQHLHISLSTTTYNFELEKVKSIVSNNGYFNNIVNKTSYRKRRPLILNIVHPTPIEITCIKFYKLNFVKEVIRVIKYILRKYDTCINYSIFYNQK